MIEIRLFSLMKPSTAYIPLTLSECLLPSELGGLVEEAARRNVDVGEVIVFALREFVAQLPRPPASGAVPAAAQPQPTGVAA